jgi:fermentation-respiration switch protein FrsA (DUF1100 family)
MLGYAVGALALILLLALAIRLLEGNMIYFPHRLSGGEMARILERIPKGDETFEEVEFETEDGVTVTGWWGTPPDPKATIVWFHGNAGNVYHRQDDFFRFVRACRLAVLIVDYRGYGRSEGSPDEAGLYLDARAALDFLVARGVPSESVYVLGRSLGGAVAIELATARPVKGLILESTFSSAKDMAKAMFRIFPAHWFIRTRFPNEERIATLELPILHFHGRRDRVVPFSQGERLAKAATKADHEFVPVDTDHNDLSILMGDEYFRRIVDFVSE